MFNIKLSRASKIFLTRLKIKDDAPQIKLWRAS